VHDGTIQELSVCLSVCLSVYTCVCASMKGKCWGICTEAPHPYPRALKSRDFLIYIRRSKRGKKHINKPLLNEPSFIVIDFYRTLNGINKQTNPYPTRGLRQLRPHLDQNRTKFEAEYTNLKRFRRTLTHRAHGAPPA